MDGKVPLASITMLAVPTNASLNDKEQQDHSLPFDFLRISRLYREEGRPTTHGDYSLMVRMLNVMIDRSS